MDFKAILRTFLKIILPLAFGCLLLWYLYSKMDIGEIWNVIRKGVRYEIILFSLLFGLGANIVRGLRWGLDMESVDYLEQNFPVLEGKILAEDFLRLDLGKLFPDQFCVIGNYPYNISSQIVSFFQ